MRSESTSNWPDQASPALVPAHRRRWPFILVGIFVLALSGAGGAYAWLNTGLFSRSGGREAAATDDVSGKQDVLADLLAAQQKTTDDLAAIDRAIADQQEQLKAIVSQLASLSSKVDAMKKPVLPAPVASAPPPGSAAAAPAPVVAPVAAARVASKQKKPPQAASSSGPLSVGGAPLNMSPR